jgi:hypothetical protein
MLADGIKCTQNQSARRKQRERADCGCRDTRTECRFILIACLPMASVLPIDSAADRQSGDFGKSPFLAAFRAR